MRNALVGSAVKARSNAVGAQSTSSNACTLYVAVMVLIGAAFVRALCLAEIRNSKVAKASTD